MANVTKMQSWTETINATAVLGPLPAANYGTSQVKVAHAANDGKEWWFPVSCSFDAYLWGRDKDDQLILSANCHNTCKTIHVATGCRHGTIGHIAKADAARKGFRHVRFLTTDPKLSPS